MFPGRWHSVWVFQEIQADGSRRFAGYYVNLEEPFRRTASGFDTNDHSLDIVVDPDLTWSWKDQDDFEDRVRQGVYSEPFAQEVRAEAARVIAAIETRASPFSDGWDRWTPDPTWDVPVLPPNWETEPVARWEQWRWAYPSAQ
jgi:predicted RNA-binding protein associated with RNAse of E/G family